MHPNAEDGLVPDITELFKRDYAAYKRNAIDHTARHALLAVAAPTQVITESTLARISAESPDTLVQQSVVDEHSSDNTQHVSESAAQDKLRYEYEYVADGYTLVGCNPGCPGQVLQLTVNDCDKDSEIHNSTSISQQSVVASEDGSKPNKRQRRH